MRGVNLELNKRLGCWAVYEYKLKKGEMGYPEESMIYKFWKEGYTGFNNQIKGSRVLFDYPTKEVNEVNNVYNELKKEKGKAAIAFYYYYVFHVSVKEFAPRYLKISPRTFYKWLDVAREFFIHKIHI